MEREKRLFCGCRLSEKGDLGGCAENEIELPCQLPAIQDMNELKELDSYLREQEIILNHKEASASDGMG